MQQASRRWYVGNRPTTDNSFLPSLDKIETREGKRRRREREDFRFVMQIKSPNPKPAARVKVMPI